MNEHVATHADGTMSELHRWFESIKYHLVHYQDWITEAAMLGGIAFVVGFLLKNFGRYIVSALLVAVLTIIVLQYAGIVTVTIPQLFEMLGVSGISSVPQLFEQIVAWVKVHGTGAVSIVIGFIIGWVLG